MSESNLPLEPKDARQASLASVILQLIQCHSDLHAFYRSQIAHSDREDARMLLAHLADQEAARSVALREYIRHAPRSVANAWLKTAPQFRTHEWIEKLSGQPASDFQAMLTIAHEINETLLKLVAGLDEQVQSEEVRQFLEDLYNRMKRDRIYALRSAELD